MVHLEAKCSAEFITSYVHSCVLTVVHFDYFPT